MSKFITVNDAYSNKMLVNIDNINIITDAGQYYCLKETGNCEKCKFATKNNGDFSCMFKENALIIFSNGFELIALESFELVKNKYQIKPN